MKSEDSKLCVDLSVGKRDLSNNFHNHLDITKKNRPSQESPLESWEDRFLCIIKSEIISMTLILQNKQNIQPDRQKIADDGKKAYTLISH